MSMQLVSPPDLNGGAMQFFGSVANVVTSDGSRCMIQSLYDRCYSTYPPHDKPRGPVLTLSLCVCWCVGAGTM